ncbi:helix-turn-helix domain-containing protein [Rhizobium leguminosarum bv. viciae]|uniref:helix-turn-helix domain-containing protein n=1 Tax=Rhizobium leguminosarum TaxID=384 RepID=UPI0014417E47|nr:helix-turn-helix transcriptional regulator [Rhizobium leguminosarum]NKJ92830.1 helix-turn-helix domain-containing protein [Rhizobium leguminosarum bv. viciae]NKK86685.1 helix-turn-helix domain-containing protein [Rhizobium leguminosarum bv. viciae]
MANEEDRWQKIGERLKKAREYVELKQEEAAQAVGISRSALSQIENGKRKVDAVELSNFARIYGQTIEHLSGDAQELAIPDSVTALARAAKGLSTEDQDELLRFAQFLQARPVKDRDNG